MIEELLPKVKDLARKEELEDRLQKTYKRLLEIEEDISKGVGFAKSVENRLSMIEEGSEEGGGGC